MYNIKNKNIMDSIQYRDINVMHSCVNDRNDLVNGLICSNVGSPISVSYTHLTLPTNREV